MDTQSPATLHQEALSYIRYVKRELFHHPLVFKHFQQTFVNFINQVISPESAAANINCLFNNHPELLLGFQKFLPINQEIDVQKSKGTDPADIESAMKYVNRVLQGLENDPDMVSRFFELMETFRHDSDEPKLKQGLSALFKLHPEFEIEFLQCISEDPFPGPHEDASSEVRVIPKNSFEVIMNSFEDKLFLNDMKICGMKSALDNTIRLLDECWKNPETAKVTSYLTCKNLEVIKKYCQVELEKSRNIEESAYVVVGKLRHNLEQTKKVNVDAIRMERARKLERFRRRQ